MLSERQQKQRIYAIYAGGDTRPDKQDPDEYIEPWRSVLAKLQLIYAARAPLWKRMEQKGGDWRAEYHEELLDCLAPAARILRTHPHDVVSILAEAGRQRRQFQSGEEIVPNLRPTTWLWETWIPREYMTLLGAAPKTGKSWLALDLARLVIDGGTWPDGQRTAGGGTVVWVEAENVLNMTLTRAKRMGVDLNRFWPLEPRKGDIMDLTGGAARDDLIELVQQVQPDLIIIDSLSGITSKGENAVEDVRRLMAFLVEIAEEFSAGLVLIHHLKKLDRMQLSLPGLGLADFRGSSHITAAARSILGLSVQTPAGSAIVKSGPRRLEVVAASLCQAPEPLGMTIEDQPGGGLTLVYGDVPTANTPTAGEECSRWMMELLQANGPMRPKDVVDLGDAEGYIRSMVFGTAKRLREAGIIVNTMGQSHPKNEWRLADDAEIEEEI